MKEEEVRASLQSVEGRERLLEQILAHQDDLKEIYDGGFDPKALPALLGYAGTTLAKEPTMDTRRLEEMLEEARQVLEWKERYIEDIQSPEKKGLLRRAFDKVKSFAKKHPVVTALLIAAVAAGGVAAGFYLTGNWELLATSLGLDKMFGAADAAGELMPPVPSTPIPPGAGELAVPPPALPLPGAGGPI